jgi:hypothetical protein
MTVTAIDENSPYLKQVIALARANSSTLGFLPKAVFVSGARCRTLLVATDEKANFLGYLLYGISAKKMLAYIVHLCVNAEHRKKKVATILVQKLKAQTNDALGGIRVRCRRDYEASKVWPSLGFSALGEMPGRGRKETTLTVWRLDYGHPTLFTLLDDLEGSARIKVSMDANVFYKLGEPPNLENEECQALLADWLTEAIELCVTNELFNEIDRHADKEVRSANRRFAQRFRVVSGPEDQFEETIAALRLLFPGRLTTSDKSDIRQLSRSFAAGIQFFVTLDPRLLRKTDEIFEAVGIRVLRPADLILEQDSLIREAEYQPVRLAGAAMAIERARPMEQLLLNESFRAPQRETKQQFEALLNSLLADPHEVEVKIVKDTDRPQALLAFKRSKEIELEVPIMRIDRGLSSGLASTLMRYLIQELVLASAKEGRAITRITDQYLSADSIEALRDNGFSPSNGTWFKINLRGVMSAQELLVKLSAFESEAPWVRQYIHNAATIIETAVASGNHNMLLSIEKALWPVKITGTSIRTFIVPILPEWAMHLFDTGIGSQNLFGGNPNLIFKVENAYYRNSSPRVLFAPGRILWYVSKHSGKYQDTESVRACSYLEDVVVDRPKALFTRFHRLGVYKWNDLVRLAKKDLDRNIMGFRFAKTEILTRPIDKKTLQKFWHEQLGKNFHIQCPLRIPEQVFFDLYSMGL